MSVFYVPAVDRHRQAVAVHSCRLDALGLAQRVVNVCTTDPVPLLVASIKKYQDRFYIGRGELSTHVDTRKPWTTAMWSRISAQVPADGVPLMLGIYSDAFIAAKKSHHPFRYYCVFARFSLLCL